MGWLVLPDRIEKLKQPEKVLILLDFLALSFAIVWHFYVAGSTFGSLAH
jgi:hypothetical protein